MDFELLFVIGNHKCGTQAIRHALQAAEVPFIPTDRISVSEGLDAVVQKTGRINNKITVVQGHPSQIKFTGENETDFDFVNSLFNRSKLILPSRNPVTLAISWLEYSRTRLLGAKEASAEHNKNIEAFRYRLSEYANIDYRDLSPDTFQHPYSEPIENILKWIEVVAKNSAWLWGQSCNLFYPKWPKLKEAYDKQKRLNLGIADLVASRKAFIFDSQCYSTSALAELEALLGKGFVEVLKVARRNVSLKSLPNLSRQDAYWVEKAMREICDFDFQIYEQAI